MATAGAKVHFVGDWDGTGVKKAQQDISAFEKQATGFGKSITGSFTGIGASIGGALAIGTLGAGLLTFLQDSAAAAVEDEKSLRMLNTTLSNLGFKSATDEVAAFVDKAQATYGFLDDDLRPAFARLVRSTDDVAEAEKALQTAMDISIGTGKSLDVVAAALGKAYDGNAASLGRLGLGLDKAVLKSSNMAEIMPKLNKMFGGQAAAAAETYEGKLKRVSIAADEAKETIGYSLLKALDKTSQAFGGTQGAVGALTAAGDSLANFITGASTAVIEIGKLTAAITKTDDATTTHAVGVAALAAAYLPMVPVAGSLYAAYTGVAEAGNKVAEAEEYQARVTGAAADRYTALANSIRPTTQQILENNAAAEAAAVELDKAAAAADKVTSSTIRATDALKTWQQAISQSGSMDKWHSDLLKIEQDYKDLNTSLSRNNEAGLKNRDTIRGYASDLIAAVEDWGTRYNKTVTERIEKQATEGKKLRDGLIAQGFKPKDVDAFLGGLGIWNTQMKLIASGMSRGQAATSMRNSGLILGGEIYKGIIAGLQSGAGPVNTAVTILATSAINKANQILEINSPSKVFQRMGNSIVDGTVKGITEKTPEVSQAAKDMAQAIVDKAQTMVDGWDEKLATLKDKFVTAKTELFNAAKDIASTIMNGIDFGAANSMTTVGANGEAVGMSFMDGLKAQAAQAIEFATRVKDLVARGLSPAAIQQVLDAGATAGIAIANELVAGGSKAIDETNQLVASAQKAADQVGILTAVNWYGAGVTSAQKTYEGFRDAYGPDSEVRKAIMKVMDRLSKDMERTTTVTVQTVYEAAGISGKRALGGPVTAGDAWIVGEKGPEVFVPSTNGNVIPNGGLPIGSGGFGRSAGGTSYTINVQAGVGDPRQIGQAIVEYVTKFEKASGKVWAAA